MADLLIRANTGATRIEVAAFLSTEATREAARAHDLSGTAAIALGRLLTATGLVGITSRRPGVTSIQVISQSRIGQVFADVTEHGWLRGYVRNGALKLPLVLSENLFKRRTIGPAVHPGQVSVVRMGEAGSYTQSATPLRDGEIDSDVEHFLNQSDQVASVLRCETLVNKDGDIVASGGVLIRALPDSVLEDIVALEKRLGEDVITDVLERGGSAEDILSAVAPTAAETDPRVVPIWKCRCSKEKVLSTVGMLDIMEIAQLVARDESVEVKCELCNTTHVASPTELEDVIRTKQLPTS